METLITRIQNAEFSCKKIDLQIEIFFKINTSQDEHTGRLSGNSIRYTSSIDKAMELKPEGVYTLIAEAKDICMVSVSIDDGLGGNSAKWRNEVFRAKTIPLALCLAFVTLKSTT
jgi:hypothetical protein